MLVKPIHKKSVIDIGEVRMKLGVNPGWLRGLDYMGVSGPIG